MQKKGKKRQANKEYALICPECKSADVRIDKTNPLQAPMGLPSYYTCNRCGHSSNSFPEIRISELEVFEREVDEKHLRKYKKDATPLVDTSYGQFEVHFVWKFLGPALFITGIVMLFFKEALLFFIMNIFTFFYSIRWLSWVGVLTGSYFFSILLILLGAFMVYTTYFKKKG